MLRRLCLLAIVVCALTPAAYLAWTFRSMPQFGFYHDDSIYWVSAKSLADGNGYRIESLPNQPYQTKYPPLYPALLSLIWRLAPEFPANLKLATLVAWLLFPVWLLAVWAFLRKHSLEPWEQWSLLVAAAINPIATVFSFSLMPELLFTSLFVLGLLLAERARKQDSPVWLALAAGLVCGLAYLAKSAAMPVLLTAPLCFLLVKQRAKAAVFFCGMAPAVIGWQAWVATHVSHSWDIVTLYYTNYFGFQVYNVPLVDLPLVVWRNLDGLLIGIGKLLTFDIEIGSKNLERVVAVAAIAGVIRLARQTRTLQYPLAAAGFSALLLVWHYQPDQRFVFPLYPLLLAGLWTELKNVARALKLAWEKHTTPDRIAAAIGATALAGFAGFVVFTNLHGDFSFVPMLMHSYSSALEDRRPAYAWLAQNSPASANVLAYDDPPLFLYAGRKSCGLPIPPTLYYHDDDPGIEKLLRNIPNFARQQHIDYVLLTAGDFYRDLHDPGAKHLADAVAQSSAFREMYRTPGAAIYQYVAPTVQP